MAHKRIAAGLRNFGIDLLLHAAAAPVATSSIESKAVKWKKANNGAISV
jgi:hypothetical protein